MSSRESGNGKAILFLLFVLIQAITVIIVPRLIVVLIITIIPLWIAAACHKCDRSDRSVTNTIAVLAVLVSFVVTPTEYCGALLFIHMLTFAEIIIVVFTNDKCVYETSQEHIHNYNRCSCGAVKRRR